MSSRGMLSYELTRGDLALCYDITIRITLLFF